MRVHYRIHKIASAQETFYLVEEEYATGWQEVKYYSVRLCFRSSEGAIEFIRALDGHRGGYTDDDLREAMVVNS